ncbi:MAG: hypothetical protein WC759_03630 [Candidatus Micrarchaeia archaeon]|jgi:hypothetical protein
MADLKLTEKMGSLYLNGKLLVTKLEIEKYGLPAVELALLRRTGNVAVALDLLGEARQMVGKLPEVLKGVSFLENSSAHERQAKYLHHTLPLADEKGKRHELDLVRFGKSIWGIFVDGNIIATNSTIKEPKDLVSGILQLADAKLKPGDVQRLNEMLAKVASMKSAQDYIVLSVARGTQDRQKRIAA